MVLLAGTAIAFGFAAGAWAETGAGAKPPSAAERSRARFFERFDADKDGKVTKAEFLGARASQFKAADKDGDGLVTREEFAAFGDLRRDDAVDRLFARLDKNADGKLTADEFAGRAGKKARSRGRIAPSLNFERADAEKKGYLTLADLAKYRGAKVEARLKRRFDALDVNRDGKLSADELASRRGRSLKRADADKDGTVTFDEYAARARHSQARRVEIEFKAFDADGDGKLSKAEAAAARGKPMLLLVADADHDGAVTKAELAKSFAGRGAKAQDRFFARLDKDEDGKLALAEWQAAGERRFARLDRNKDGTVTADEIGRRARHGHRPRHKKTDR
jgi:Ca2+-binding EF-hand superfamily protein